MPGVGVLRDSEEHSALGQRTLLLSHSKGCRPALSQPRLRARTGERRERTWWWLRSAQLSSLSITDQISALTETDGGPPGEHQGGGEVSV